MVATSVELTKLEHIFALLCLIYRGQSVPNKEKTTTQGQDDNIIIR